MIHFSYRDYINMNGKKRQELFTTNIVPWNRFHLFISILYIKKKEGEVAFFKPRIAVGRSIDLQTVFNVYRSLFSFILNLLSSHRSVRSDSLKLPPFSGPFFVCLSLFPSFLILHHLNHSSILRHFCKTVE